MAETEIQPPEPAPTVQALIEAMHRSIADVDNAKLHGRDAEAVAALAFNPDPAAWLGIDRLMALVDELSGRPHDAVAQLRIALGAPVTVTVAELRASALWDPLRNDAEFKALLAR